MKIFLFQIPHSFHNIFQKLNYRLSNNRKLGFIGHKEGDLYYNKYPKPKGAFKYLQNL